MQAEEFTNEVLSRLAKIETIISEGRVPQEWYSIKQTATLTGLSQDHIRRHVTGGTLSCSNVGTPDRPIYRIFRGDIVAWMDKRRAGAFAPAKKKPTKKILPSNPHFRPSALHNLNAA